MPTWKSVAGLLLALGTVIPVVAAASELHPIVLVVTILITVLSWAALQRYQTKDRNRL